jgi:cell wall-associated NlpC family hydrolase
MIEPSALAHTLAQWIGVPYLHQGRSRHGVDCVGLVFCALREAGALRDRDSIPSAYVPRVGSDLLLREIEATCTRANHAETGVLVLIQWPREKFPTHCGVIVGNDLIHCHARARAVVCHGYRRPWNSWTHSLWYLPDVTYE